MKHWRKTHLTGGIALIIGGLAVPFIYYRYFSSEPSDILAALVYSSPFSLTMLAVGLLDLNRARKGDEHPDDHCQSPKENVEKQTIGLSILREVLEPLAIEPMFGLVYILVVLKLWHSYPRASRFVVALGILWIVACVWKKCSKKNPNI